MAKVAKSVTFKSAVINFEEDTIMEVLKDEVKTYRLSAVLKEWDGVEGLNLTFKQEDVLPEHNVDDEANGEE